MDNTTKTLVEHEADIEAEYARNPGLQCRCFDDSGSCDYCQLEKEKRRE